MGIRAHGATGIAARYAGTAGIIALAIALAVLLGWISGVRVLTGLVTGWPQMAPLTAAAAALCALTLLLASGNTERPASPDRRRVVLGCAALVTLVGLTRLTAHVFGMPAALDTFGMQDLAATEGSALAMMSPATALAFILLGCALALAHSVRQALLHQIFAVLALLVGWLGMARFLFGGVPLIPFSRMALHTALLLLLLASGVLALRKDVGVTALLASEGPAGLSARRLLPAAFIVPLIIGALALYAQRSDALGVEQSFALFAVSSVVVFAGLVWASASQLHRTDMERRRAREALSASEARTRLIIETALDAVVTIDHAGIITGWSRQAELLFGWSAGQAVGQVLAQTIIPEQYREAHQRGLERYLATGTGPLLNRRIEITALRRDQTEFPVELAITPLRSDEEVSFSAFVRDITERRRAETALRESQQLLQSIIDNSPALIYAKYLDGRYLLINRRFEEIFDLQRDAVLGRTDHDLFAREAADAIRSMDLAVSAAGHAVTREEIAPHVDGPRDYLSVKAPLCDGAGRAYAIVGVSTDITERKRGEQRLRAQFERLNLLDRTTRAIGERQDLRSIFQVAIGSLEEHLPIDFGCIGLYERANQTIEITGIGTRSHSLAVELGLLEHARIKIDANGLGRCVRGQLVHEPDIAGSTFPFPAQLARGGLRALVIAPLSVENEVFGVMIAARRAPAGFASTDCEFLRQLSEHLALAAHQAQLYASLQQANDDLRRTQQSVMQQERLRALGQMASGIAHDINNALSPAALYAQSLLERDQSLSREARENLTVIQRAIEDVGRTVARMRMLYGTREPDLKLTHVDLGVLLQQVAELTRARWHDMPQERGVVIELRRDLASNLPPIMGAENEIRDALTNLVLNAVDAMPDGGTLTLRSRVRTEPATNLAHEVSIEVCDTGTGMSEAIRSKCLEPFFTTKGERGTGLGLAMVYGMIQRHGAGIEIESEPGVGTTVRLIFRAAAQMETLGLPLTHATVRPLHILLVDDDPLMLEALENILRTDGHSVVSAEGGQNGIDAFMAAREQREPFDLVITDLGMPKVDGRAVAAAIKSAAPGTPVMLLTGWGQRLQEERELPEHVDRVLSKPPRLADLRAAIAERTSRFS